MLEGAKGNALANASFSPSRILVHGVTSFSCLFTGPSLSPLCMRTILQFSCVAFCAPGRMISHHHRHPLFFVFTHRTHCFAPLSYTHSLTLAFSVLGISSHSLSRGIAYPNGIIVPYARLFHPVSFWLHLLHHSPLYFQSPLPLFICGQFTTAVEAAGGANAGDAAVANTLGANQDVKWNILGANYTFGATTVYAG